MSRNIVIYTDGSQMLRLPKNLAKKSNVKDSFRKTISWAFVALHDDQLVECSGIKTDRKAIDKHEWFAMMEAYLYATSHGFSIENISIFTDCQDFSDFAFSSMPENRRFVSRDKWLSRIDRFVKTFYKHVNAKEFIKFLQTARIHKVKSHSFLVYNVRVDQLAKSTLIQFYDPTRRSLPNFEEWIKFYAGFKVAFASNIDKVLQ